MPFHTNVNTILGYKISLRNVIYESPREVENERIRAMRPAELGSGAVRPDLEDVRPTVLDLEVTEARRPTNAEPWRPERSGVPEWRSVGGSTRRSYWKIQYGRPHVRRNRPDGSGSERSGPHRPDHELSLVQSAFSDCRDGAGAMRPERSTQGTKT